MLPPMTMTQHGSVFITLLLIASSLADDKVIFGDGGDVSPSQETSGQCVTIDGPGQGSGCQFPFIYKGVPRDGCITEADPEGKLWCSTAVDSDGQHIVNGQHWAHCSAQCPVASSSAPAQTSSAFTVIIIFILAIYRMLNIDIILHSGGASDL